MQHRTTPAQPPPGAPASHVNQPLGWSPPQRPCTFLHTCPPHCSPGHRGGWDAEGPGQPRRPAAAEGEREGAVDEDVGEGIHGPHQDCMGVRALAGVGVVRGARWGCGVWKCSKEMGYVGQAIYDPPPDCFQCLLLRSACSPLKAAGFWLALSASAAFFKSQAHTPPAISPPPQTQVSAAEILIS